MFLTSTQQNMISNILRANGAAVGYVFGSYARGTAGYLSDLDLAVIFSTFIQKDCQENLIEKSRNQLEVIFGKDKVDIVNIEAINSPLLRYIILLGEGVPLFVDDIVSRNRLSVYAQHEYEDTKPLRRIQSQALTRLFV